MISEAQDIDLSLLSGFLRGIRPDPIITVSQWADAKRMLPATSAEPGRFRTSRTPYAREIMDKLSVSDPAQKLIVMKGSQLGFTEIGNNWVGYCIDLAPGPFLFIMPTDMMMKMTSKQRIEKMIDDSPDLRSKIARARGKDGGNSLLYKEFPGGFLRMVGANSPVGLSSIPARFVYLDEIDRYPESVGNEGSAVDLADTRTSTFGNRRKELLTSTPTLKGTSQIEAEFEKTGQRFFNVPCPYCSSMIVFQFGQLRYAKGKYENVHYECQECGTLIEEHKKDFMLAGGLWIPRFPEKEDGYTFGYHISAMYSPYGMYSWGRMAKDYEDAQGDIPKTIVFVNTKLGQSYEEVAGDKPDWENIYDRAENYPDDKPFPNVAFLTAGVDVQKDRLELEVVGWIKGKISQSVTYMQLVGDTSHDEVWDELGKILAKTWVREGDNALLSIRLMALDTGYNSQKAYEFARKHGVSRVIPIKGDERLSVMFAAPKAVEVSKAGKKIGSIKVWRVGVGHVKSEIYGFLGLRIDSETGKVPPGYCHFPKREPSYFRGLTAEELVKVTNKRNYEVFQWVKKYKRNEPLDCRVYARAAAAVLAMDRWSDSRWALEGQMYDRAQVQMPPRVSQESKSKPKKSSFWGDMQ